MIGTEKFSRKRVARDLMAEAVVTVPQHMSLGGAARLMTAGKVSAAPVTDARGRCLGLLTASALVPLLARGAGTRLAACREPAWSEWQILEGAADRKDRVGGHVRADPPMVGPETPVPEVVRVMLEAGTAHVVVVDTWGVPLGIVSAAQALAGVARAHSCCLPKEF